MTDPFDSLCRHARAFADEFSARRHADLFGITDGKAVGTYIEAAFKAYLRDRDFITADEGNAAVGVDLPTLGVDIKVTSLKQPQSSSPFRSFRQKVEGLGYHLILFVYSRLDELSETVVTFEAIRFIPSHRTGDHQTTSRLRELIADGGNVDDVFAFLVERNIPGDEESLYEYAEELVSNVPELGYLTISNALQWRLQYRRVVDGVCDDVVEI